MRIRLQEPVDTRFNDLLDRLGILRLRPVLRPTYEDGTPLNPQLPPDLTRLNDQELGSLYTAFCAMAQWVGFQHGLATAARAKLEMEAKRVRSRVFLQQSGNREEKAAKADTHPEVIRVEDEMLLAQNLEALTYPVLNSYLIGKESTSREMTRRQGTDWNRGGMGNSSIPRSPTGFRGGQHGGVGRR